MNWLDSPEYDDMRYQSIGPPPVPRLTQGNPWEGQEVPELSNADQARKERVNRETSWLDWLSPSLRQAASGVPVEDPQKALADLLGWIDVPATKGVPLAAGMVNFAQRAYKNALAHRTIRPDEVGILEKLFANNVKTELPASFVTPNYTGVFHGNDPNPGVLFHVKDPKEVRWAAPRDVFSSFEHKGTLLEPDPTGPLYDPVKIQESIPADRYQKTLTDLDAIDPLGDLLTRQLELLKKERPNPSTPKLWHNEMAYRAGDPESLAGIRMPLPGSPEEASAWSNKKIAPLMQQLEEMASQRNLPRYHLPQPGSAAEQAAQIEAELAGKPRGWTPQILGDDNLWMIPEGEQLPQWAFAKRPQPTPVPDSFSAPTGNPVQEHDFLKLLLYEFPMIKQPFLGSKSPKGYTIPEPALNYWDWMESTKPGAQSKALEMADKINELLGGGKPGVDHWATVAKELPMFMEKYHGYLKNIMPVQ